jgi:hypothetical protein
MTGLRNTLLALAVALPGHMSAQALAGSGPRPASDAALALAACHARYSALVEHSWLDGGEDLGARLRRDWISAMMEAGLATANDRRSLDRTLLSHRISEKAQTKALLRTATYGHDPRRQRMARSLLQSRIGACDDLVLSRRIAGF